MSSQALDPERPTMQDSIQPLIHKAAVQDIAVHIARSGLSIGDEATLHSLTDGRIGVFAARRRRLLGLIPQRVTTCLGTLGPQAATLIGPAVEAGFPLRVRIVGLTPEHLAGEGAPEIHISVWGAARQIGAAPPTTPARPGLARSSVQKVSREGVSREADGPAPESQSAPPGTA